MTERKEPDAKSTARREASRIRKVEGLADFFGKNLWHGDLSEMRKDRVPRLVREAQTKIKRRRA
jgi:hypothetical protein